MKTLLLSALLLISCGQPTDDNEDTLNQPGILTNYPGVSYYKCTIGEIENSTGIHKLVCTDLNGNESFIELGY